MRHQSGLWPKLIFHTDKPFPAHHSGLILISLFRKQKLTKYIQKSQKREKLLQVAINSLQLLVDMFNSTENQTRKNRIHPQVVSQ